MTTPIEFSEALSRVVETLGPSVVQVDARRHHPSSGIVWGDGHVVTAAHAVEREEGIEVRLHDGSTATATLAGRDPSTDVALLKVDKPGLSAPTWRPLTGLKVGNLVLALSRPGKTVRASLGIVNALSPDEWQAPAGGRIERYLQTDAGLQLGYSGSLLVDVSGAAVGMNTRGLTRGEGVTVPHATLARVVASLLQHGRVRRGFLGVGAYPVRLPDALARAAGQGVGLILVGTQAGGPAEGAGLMQGDVLLTLDGKPLGDLGELHALLDESTIGKTAELKFARAGKVEAAKVTVGSR